MREDPLGYDVLMDLMHKMVAHVKTGNEPEWRRYFGLREALTKEYPEAEKTIEERWGGHREEPANN